MYSNDSMNRRRPNYQQNQQRGVIPFLVGGALGYGIGVNQRPNQFVPVPVVPIFPPRPFYPYQPFFYPGMYRR